MVQRLLFFSLIVLLTGCASNDLVEPYNCSSVSVSVALVSKTDVSGCSASDGSIEVIASNGQGPYQYRINGGAFSSAVIFANLASGTGYTLEAKDANGCIGVLTPAPSINNLTSTLTAQAIDAANDTECLTDNGSFTITASGGKQPYTYNKNNGPFTDNATFANLATGTYTIIVKDADGCTFTVTKTISRGDTGTSWSGEIQNIISTNCAVSGCHVSGGQPPNLSTLNGVQTFSNSVKSRTGNGSMPPSSRTDLTANQIKKIACWVDDGAKNN
jgi:hypothetical protein